MSERTAWRAVVDERGRSVQSVIDQYLTTVKPMHGAYAEPSKRFADLIVPATGSNEAAQELLVAFAKERRLISHA